MERKQPTPVPQKSNSFSSTGPTRDEKICRRNLSLGAIHFEDSPAGTTEGDEQKEKNADGNQHQEEAAEAEAEVEAEDVDDNEEPLHTEDSLVTLIDDIDHFLAILLSLGEREGNENGGNDDSISDLLPEIPEPTIEKFVMMVDEEIAKYETGEKKLSLEHDDDDETSILDAIDRTSKLTDALSRFPSHPKYFDTMNVTGSLLQHAMAFFEDEFYSLLDESSKCSKDLANSMSKTKRPPSFSRISHEHERPIMSPPADPTPADYFPSTYSLRKLQAIANSMISAGYDIECCAVFRIARRNAFRASMTDIGFEKIAIDDVQKMPWDQLEGEVVKWSKSFRQLITTGLCLEREICYSVFAGHKEYADEIFYNLASNRIHNLLNFPEALAMTKRSSEKLFKVLDMYEALKEMIPKVNLLFPLEGKEGGGGEKKSEDNSEEGPSIKEEKSEEKSVGEDSGGESEEERVEEENPEEESSSAAALKTEICAVRTRVGEAAVAIFCELENSIKSDGGKNAVPGGAVHPLTRYVMNYLKYACEYISTLELIFKDHRKLDDGEEESSQGSDSHKRNGSGSGSSKNNQGADHTPFQSQLTQVMDLLKSNIESKARLYKDLALTNIFLMNNGRYMVQKIKGSPEINKLLGNTWCRRRSSDLRQYHKNYQRETWSKVLACFKEDGLTVKGSVYKPVLKERFKSFNALFDEIHRVQSTWIVSDEQLQSELRVSISAVIIPAYRSFLGRFSQYLDPGRQTEKYIKLAADDIETAIDDLFEGNPASMVRRR